jgi:undecaprenyl-diphosphatase
MLNTLIILCAKYLYIVVVLIGVVYIFLQPREKQKRVLLLAIITLPIAYIVAKIGSVLYFDPRPFVVGNFAPLVPHIADNGFPSDHTLLTSAIASVVYPYSRRIGIILWILALAVGISRIAAGIHHPIDIIGSIVISIVVTSIVYRFINRGSTSEKYY